MDGVNLCPFLQLTTVGFWETVWGIHKWSLLWLGYVFDGTKMLDDVYKNHENVSKVR